jgi:hypothetical protein
MIRLQSYRSLEEPDAAQGEGGSNDQRQALKLSKYFRCSWCPPPVPQ